VENNSAKNEKKCGQSSILVLFPVSIKGQIQSGVTH